MGRLLRPVRRAVGISLLVAGGASAESLDLAQELLADADWPAARREAMRAAIALARPESERARAMAAIARIRGSYSPEESAAALAELQRLAETAERPDVRGSAALEVGHHLLRQGCPDEAWPWLARAFRAGVSDETTLAAGAELLWLGRMNPSRWRRDPDLRLQIASLRVPLWNMPLVARERRGPPLSARPGLWFTRFYRRQIRPAIGNRCQLRPTCSEYFVQAARRYGWRAIPLLADRLVREPSVVQAAEHPLYEQDRVVYPDPVEAHSFWWAGSP